MLPTTTFCPAESRDSIAKAARDREFSRDSRFGRNYRDASTLLETRFQPQADAVADYYYTSAEHWASDISSKIQKSIIHRPCGR